MTLWPIGPQQPHLAAGDVHVWQGSLSMPPQRLAAYQSTLTPDEQERAARFHFDGQRNRYIAGRGMLRLILGRYLHQPPSGLDFSYSEYGKPFLAHSDVQFNLAHSGGLAVFAFCLNDEIGVDVEEEREISDALAICERFFSPAERETMRSLPREQQTSAFFRCWSRKEAFIKAVGEGLSYPLDAFDVTLAPGETARLSFVGGSAEEARAWSLTSLDLPRGYHGALAVRGSHKGFQAWRIED